MAGSSTSPPSISPTTRWLILVLASIGFAFDIYELLMLPLVAPYALPAMGIATGTPEFSHWVRLLFYVPAVFGGIFGLLGGYLTDWLGRRRVLTWSILLYAFSAFFAGFSTSPEMLLILRTTTFIGVCVEFVAAVAWLAELFPIPDEREKALGYSQAFSSLGGLLVAIAFGICNTYGQYWFAIEMPDFLKGWLGEIRDPHAPWRYTLMSGLIPAFPLLIIRPFLPESPIWQQKKNAGTLKRPSVLALFTTPQMRRTTIVTTIMFACSYGVAFGAIQHIPRILPGREDVQHKIQEEVKDLSGPALKKAEKQAEGKLVSGYVKVQEIGGLVGRFLFAAIVIYFASQRALLRVFQDGKSYMDPKGQFRTTIVFDNLIHKKKIPLMIGIFINPGVIKNADGKEYKNRSFEYDSLSNQYALFLENEILPEVGKKYKLRQDAAGRGICGISSGGICAFTAAWERPDLFSKVLSHVGSFTNIRGGDRYPGIIRKTPKKNIRVFLQDGKKDLDNEHGNWWLGNLQMESALKYKSYDHKVAWGEGGHDGKHGGAILPESLIWLWRDTPAAEVDNSKKVDGK